ncbi:MAG: rplR [Candidatus Saccharibacteria bacterium]|nr:rplR [Candidatus Saccharibacteria bacterium]
MANATLDKLNRRRARVRATVTGSTARPRLSVKISLSHVIAQIVDDSKGHTLAYVSTVGHWVGEQIAALAKAKKVKQVVFDRNGRIYHGRLAALADAARKNGLEF